jgi:hypothetical protein
MVNDAGKGRELASQLVELTHPVEVITSKLKKNIDIVESRARRRGQQQNTACE